MAGGGALGKVVARIGADTSDFQEKLNDAGKDVDRFAQAVDKVGNHLEAGVANPLLLAGTAARQFGGQVAEASTQAGDALFGIGSAAAGTVGEVGRLGDSVLSAVANIGSLSNQAVSLTKLTPAAAAAMGGLAAAVFGVGYEIGTLIEKHTTLTNFLKDKAPASLKEYGDALYRNDAEMGRAVEHIEQLKTALKLSGPEWEVNGRLTRENAQHVAALEDQLTKMLSARAKESQANYQSQISQETLNTTVDNGAAVLERYAQGLANSYGIMTRQDVQQSMDKQVADLLAMSENGASAAEILKGMSSAVERTAEAAAGYQNLKMPEDFKQLSDAVANGSVAAIEALAARLKTTLPEGASAGSTATKKVLEDAGKEWAGALSGGFGTGVQEGISYGNQAIEAWRKEIGSQVWTVNFKMLPVNLALQLRELGFDVPNSGQVPA